MDVAELTFGRLRGLHAQFQDANDACPDLRCLIVRPFDESTLASWPLFPYDSDADSIGLDGHYWRQLFVDLNPRDGLSCKPFDQANFISIGGEIWQAGFYNGAPQDDRDVDAIQKQLRRLESALNEFRQLSRLAADHFDMPPDPNLWENCGAHHLSLDKADRWLEKLFITDGIWEPVEGSFVSIRRLKADVFLSSAKAIEALATTKASDMPIAPVGVTAPIIRKESTASGDGRHKLIPALTLHHKYQSSGCLNFDPIGVSEIARTAGTAKSTATEFFKKEFGGHSAYKAACGNKTKLIVSLKTLNGELAPRDLIGLPESVASDD